MAGTGRPGRPKGSKNKPRVTSTSAPNADNPSASSSLDTGRPASSNQPSNNPPVRAQSSLPPSVMASLERPSVTNYARNHPIFSGSGKISEKKYIKEVKAFASAKNINEDFVNSCIAEAKRLLEERKTDGAASAKDMGDRAARPDDLGPEKKRKKHKTKESSEQVEATSVIKQEEPEEPVKEKRKKHKKKDEPSAPVSTQDIAVKQEPEEPVVEHDKPRKNKKKHESSENAALALEKPAAQAEDANGKKPKKHKKGKAPDGTGDSASAANPVFIKSEEPSTESKSSKKKHKSHPEAKSADAPERRPTETPIPLPTSRKSEKQKDPEEPVSKSKPSKKRKRDRSDDGISKPAPDEAEASDVGHVSKKKKKHGKSGHESDSRTAEGKKDKKDKKKKHKTHQASRSPSPPPRKKTKRVQHDGETTNVASEAPRSSHKSHEHADKGKEKKVKKTKEPDTSEVSRPGAAKSVASNRDMASEGSEDERPIQTEDNSRTSKKKAKKERRKSKLSESLETQPVQPSDAMDVESPSKKLGAEHEAKIEKHSKKARRKSIASQEALAALPFAGAQDSPAKPSKSGNRQHHDSKSAKFLPPPAASKRKRSPSPPSDHEIPPRDARKSSLASTTSVFSLPTLTRFANDSLMFPEPPEGMSNNAKKRWRKKFRKSMQRLPNEARPVTGSGVDASAPQKAPAGAKAAKSDDESDSGKKPDRKKAKVEHDSNSRQHENDAVSKVPTVLKKHQASTSQDATVHRPAPQRPQVTATGSFAHDEPLSPVSSPERPASAHEEMQDSISGEATTAEPITRKPHVNSTGRLAHDEPLPTVISPEKPVIVRETPAPPAASESPLKSDAQDWDALPAQYLSDSDQEARDASDVEPDTPIKAAEPLRPQQTGDEDANTESSKNSESESESESDSESEAEEPFKPRPLPLHLPKTPSQIFTPSKRPLPEPPSLQAQPLFTLSQLKASTPSLAANTRAAVPPKPKTPPKANRNVDILGIPHGTDDSDEESSGSSSSSDDDDGDRKTNVKANATKPTSLHFPSSQPGRSFAKPKTPLQGNSAPAVRKPSAAPEMSTAQMQQPPADSDAGSGDGDSSDSASSDDDSDDDPEVAVNGKEITPPQAQRPQEIKLNRPEKSPSKRDEPRKTNSGIGLQPQESDDETSSESESDGEEDGTRASTNQNFVSHQSQRSQHIKLESPQSSSPAPRSPQRVSAMLDSQPDEPTQDKAQLEKHSHQAESEDEGDEHVKINEQHERGGPDNPRSSSSSDAEDSAPFESALQTPAQHPSPAPHQHQLNDSASDDARSPPANDIINGIALSSSKKTSSADHDGLRREHSPADLQANEPRVNHAPAFDEGMEAETLPGADGESLKSAEKSNHKHGSFKNFGEPDSPSVGSSTNSLSVPIKQIHSSPAAASIENDELNMGQVNSNVEFEDASIPSGPPPVESKGAAVSASPSRPLRGRSRRLLAKQQADALAKQQADALAESQRFVSPESPSSPLRDEAGQFSTNQANSPAGSHGVVNPKSPPSLRNESGQSRARQRSASSDEGEGLVKSKSPPRPLRNESGRFCKRDGSNEQNRKPRIRTSRRKSAGQSMLRELGIDAETIKAEELDERSPFMTRGSQRSPAEESRVSPISTRQSRLRATPRVSYQDGYDSSESVTKTTARRLSFTSNKTRSHSRRPSSSQRSRPSLTPQPDGNLPLKVKTPFKTRSEFVGVFIPIRRPSRSVTSLDARDGKSATQQDEDVVASTADADQANDEDLAREPATPPSPSEGAQDDHLGADDRSAHEEEAPHDHDTAEDEQDRDKGYESSPSVYQSPERPVFTASLPARSAPKVVSTPNDSTSEHEGSDHDGEVDDSESEATHPDSIQSGFPRQGSPVHEKQDSGIDENEKDLFSSPEAEIESDAQDQDEHQEDFQENGQDESQEISDEDKVSEASSRGSDYSFDDEPNGFVNEDGTISGQATPRRRTGRFSTHFSPVKPARPAPGTARLEFPSTTAETFGLIQEEVYKEPWRLFVAVMLLNVTNGEKAIPKFWELMEKYPTINDLPHANLDELTLLIKPLGLQARRAETMINLTRFLISSPPTVGQRFRRINYPFKGAHRNIRPGEVLSDDDPRVGAYEVSHLPGVGPYAIDSWRIFCRDQLRGKATGFNGEDAEPGFEPEWKRVRPNDKELKGFIQWMWLREGWIWDPETGEKKRTSEDEALAASLARLRWNQKKGEAYILPSDDEGDQAPNGSLSREEGNDPEGPANEKAQASQADSAPPSHVSSPADNPSSQLEREQRNRAAQSQLAQAQLLHEEQQQRLTMSQPRPSTGSHVQRTPKAKDPNGTLLTAPATLPTRLRQTTTTATTSTSSSPVSAHRPKPTPLDLFSDDNDDSASNLGLRSLFRTPRRRRGSSAKWAAAGVVDETPPVSPRREEQQQARAGDEAAHGNDGEQDMDHFSVFGDDDDQDHGPQDTVKVNGNGNGMNGHREVGDDHGNDDDEDDDEEERLAPAGLHEDDADTGHVGEHEQQERRSPPGVVNESIPGDGSQESNKSCRVM